MEVFEARDLARRACRDTLGGASNLTSKRSFGECAVRDHVPRPELPFSVHMHRLSPNIAALGYVSLLTAISSAMIYSILPVFLMKVMRVSVAYVGLMEGMAEAANSLVKILSGTTSDWIGRRKPLVVCG